MTHAKNYTGTDDTIFFKEGIDTEIQTKINSEVSDLINSSKEDAAIIDHLHDNYAFTSEEARKELKKAKKWMGWLARKTN